MIINGKEENIATPITVAELIESKGRPRGCRAQW